jgi:NADH-quinone oxidoreductase subunit N
LTWSAFYSAADHFAVLPALLAALFGCGVLLFEFLLPRAGGRRWLLGLSLAGLAFAAQALGRQSAAVAGGAKILAFRGALTIDGFSVFFHWLLLATAALVLLLSYRYLEAEGPPGEPRAEFFGLVLLAVSGMLLLAAATDLVTIFVALELVAVCFYILTGYFRHHRHSNEAALKYFLLGSFSTGLLAYGFSIFYGLTGATDLGTIARKILARGDMDPVLFLGIATAAAGLLFKISAAPFHMWAPDAYAGAPTAVTAFLSVGSQAASFALLWRIFLAPLAVARAWWEPVLTGVAALTLTVGNLGALTQDNLKRLVAYSSIGHAGYLLLGLIAGNATGRAGMAVYLAVYALANLGVLLVVAMLRRPEQAGLDPGIEEFSGLAARHPVHAALLVAFLLSLAGIPPAAGFLGKYYIFLALLETGHTALAVAGALYAAVSAYYYFRIVRVVYTGAPSGAPLVESAGTRVALAATALGTLALGVYPEPLLRFAQLVVPK